MVLCDARRVLCTQLHTLRIHQTSPTAPCRNVQQKKMSGGVKRRYRKKYMYEVLGFYADGRVSVRFEDGTEREFETQLCPPINYLLVNSLHCTEDDGKTVIIYEGRRWRPFAPLPDGMRGVRQWEFDSFCARFPEGDPDEDWNAVVFNTVTRALKKNSEAVSA